MRFLALGVALLTVAAAQTTPLEMTLPPLAAQPACPALSPLLSEVASEVAAGADAQAAVTRRAAQPQRFRYWNVTPEQVGETLQAACASGFAEYGVAPTGPRVVVFAAVWAEGAPTVPGTAFAEENSVGPVAAEVSSLTPIDPAALPELLRWVNAVRTRGQTCGGVWKEPAPPLEPEASLALAAQGHAADMVRQGFADHTNPFTGSTPQTRAAAHGFPGKASENIRYGTPSTEGAMTWWLGSTVHCNNIMNPYWTHVGAGRAVKSPQSSYWVLMLGHQP